METDEKYKRVGRWKIRQKREPGVPSFYSNASNKVQKDQLQDFQKLFQPFQL